jgi:hypothetical protein
MSASDGALFEGDRVPASHYQYLAEGFRQGHLYVSLEPPADMLALHDPYNPVENSAYRLHDASLYHGKFYIYFGPVPALLFYLPVRILTGVYPADHVVIAVFLILGVAVWLRTLRVAAKHWFPDLAKGWFALFCAAVAFCNTGPFLLGRTAVYESAIAAGYFFAATFFHLVLLAILSPESARRYLTLAATALALAAGSRATLILLSPILPATWAWILRHKRPAIRQIVARVAPTLLPLVLGCLALGLYNYARFGNWLEFGFKTQLTYFDERGVPKFVGRHLPSGLYLYLFQPPSATVEFPFFGLEPWTWVSDRIAARLHDSNRTFVEPMAGILACYPALFVLGGLPVLFRRRGARYANLRFAVCALILAGSTLLLMLSSFFTRAMRYEMDFVPYLWIAAFLVAGVLLSSGLRIWWRAMLAGSLVFGIAVGIFLVFSGSWPGFEARRPATYAGVGRYFAPFSRLDRRLQNALALGGVRATMIAGEGRASDVQVLASDASNSDRDSLTMRYVNADTVQFACGGLYGDPVHLPIGKSIVADLYTGPFFPRSHPLFHALFPRTSYDFVASHCFVQVGGRTVALGKSSGPGSRRVQVWTGASHPPAARDVVVNSPIVSVQRISPPDAKALPQSN